MRSTFLIAAGICLCVLPTLAVEINWTGSGGTNDWSNTQNWNPEQAPAANDTITVSGDYTVVYSTASGIFGGENAHTKYIFTNGANVQLGNNTPHTAGGTDKARFNGSFEIGDLSQASLPYIYAYGESKINGTVTVYIAFNPGENNTLSFGEHGVIQYVNGSMNGVEGNNRTTTFNVVLSTGMAFDGCFYEVCTRYLIAGASDEQFNTGKYNGWTLAAGTVTGTDNTQLTQLEGDTALSADNEAHRTQFKLGHDANGVYIQYLHVVPEPATVSLGILALTCMVWRRRR